MATASIIFVLFLLKGNRYANDSVVRPQLGSCSVWITTEWWNSGMVRGSRQPNSRRFEYCNTFLGYVNMKARARGNRGEDLEKFFQGVRDGPFCGVNTQGKLDSPAPTDGEQRNITLLVTTARCAWTNNCCGFCKNKNQDDAVVFCSFIYSMH
jgi:hypothetical protein